MAKKERKKITEPVAEPAPLSIPENEIWSYQIGGLQQPRILERQVSKKTKLIIVAVLLIAIGTSIFLSIRAVHNNEYKYEVLDDGTYELIKYSNPGETTEITLDFIDGDPAKPISVLHEYAVNCDEKVVTITIGADVSEIDGKSFYSCWSLQNVFVDKDNPYFCDIDGVLYNKDMTEVIHYPCAHDRYLLAKAGLPYDNLYKSDSGTGERNKLDFGRVINILDNCARENIPVESLTGDDAKALQAFGEAAGCVCDETFLAEYNRTVRTYVIPSTVTKIGKLAFVYSKITDLYIPEGLKTIETMGFFKNNVLFRIFSYTSDKPITDTTAAATAQFATCYSSLPEGLEYIGSDAFSYNSSVSYMYIPASVVFIGHHAFWSDVYTRNNELIGLSAIYTALSKDEFSAKTETGDSWLPRYDYMLFKKKIEVLYSSEREIKQATDTAGLS